MAVDEQFAGLAPSPGARIFDQSLGNSDRFLVLLDCLAVATARRQRISVAQQQMRPGAGQRIGRAAVEHFLKLLLGAVEVGHLHQDFRQDQVPFGLVRLERHGRLRRLQGRRQIARLAIDACPHRLGRRRLRVEFERGIGVSQAMRKVAFQFRLGPE